MQNHSKSGNRMQSLDLLRCVAMMMVVVLHYLGKGGLLGELASPDLGAVGMAAWLLEAFCIVAVNVYMLISGYFLCESRFKLSRLLGLWFEVWTYSVGVGVLAAVLGWVPEKELTTYYYVRLLFPVSMGHYWFMTAYIFLYLLLPFVTMAVKRMTRQQLQTAILLLLFAFCFLKSVLCVRLDMDEKGYDCLWYLCVFLTAAYYRRFGIGALQKKGRAIGLYLVSTALIFAGTMLLRMVYLRTGSLGLLIGVCMEYNHILPFLAAIGLFCAFCSLPAEQKIGKLAGKLSPYVLGVYLLHENLGIRYVWQTWLGADRVRTVPALFLATAGAVLVVFVCGILLEAVRSAVMRALGGLLRGCSAGRRVFACLEKADGIFAEK